MQQAYIGIGSNLDDPIRQVKQALVSLGRLPHTRLLDYATLYWSKPLGQLPQADYVNTVALLETRLNAYTLLGKMQDIEKNQGRVRSTQRWAARSLDLDILLYGRQVINEPHLHVPHPGIAQRAFVLVPLLELNAHLDIPGLGSLAVLVKPNLRVQLHPVTAS